MIIVLLDQRLSSMSAILRAIRLSWCQVQQIKHVQLVCGSPKFTECDRVKPIQFMLFFGKWCINANKTKQKTEYEVPTYRFPKLSEDLSIILIISSIFLPIMKHVKKSAANGCRVCLFQDLLLSFLKLFIALFFFVPYKKKTKKSAGEPFQFGFVLNYSCGYSNLKTWWPFHPNVFLFFDNLFSIQQFVTRRNKAQSSPYY